MLSNFLVVCLYLSLCLLDLSVGVRAVRLSNKLLGRTRTCKGTFYIVSKEDLWSERRSYQTIWGPPLPNVTRHSVWWPYTMTPSIGQVLHQLLPCYWSWPYYRIWLFILLREVSIEHLQRVRHANRVRFLIRTPGPVTLWDLQVF